MTMTTKIPDGYALLPSGVLAKWQPTETKVVRVRERKKAQASSQDPLLDFVLTGRGTPSNRGRDSYSDPGRQAMSRVVEAVRTRDPLTFRTINYYDQLTVGSGITISSRNSVMDMLCKKLWNECGFIDLQHRAAIEGIMTGNKFGRVQATSRGELPIVELYPSFQITHIATKQQRPWYYTREWIEDVYPEPKKGIQEGIVSKAPTPKQRYEDIPAVEVVHSAINCGAKDLRGISPLESGIKYSLLYGRALEQVVMMQAAKAFLAVHAKISGADSNDPQVTKLRDLIDNQLVDRIDLSGISYKSLGTGQFVVTGENVDFETLGGGVNAGSNSDELRRLLLMFAVSSGMPEFALSDGNYSNLASAETQSNPFFKLMASYQSVVIAFIRALLKLSIDAMVQSGTITEIKLEPGMTHMVDYIEINAPNVLEPNIRELGYVALALVNNQIISRQEACRMLQRDWDTMMKEIEQEKKDGYFPQQVINMTLANPSTGGGEGSPSPSPAAMPDSQLERAVSHLAEEPTREDVVDPLIDFKNKLKALTRTYLNALKEADGDKAAARRAKTKWLEESRVVMLEMIAYARGLGQQSLKDLPVNKAA